MMNEFLSKHANSTTGHVPYPESRLYLSNFSGYQKAPPCLDYDNKQYILRKHNLAD